MFVLSLSATYFASYSEKSLRACIYYLNIFISFYNINSQILDMKIFVDTDSDIRLARRLKRDISERGREIEGVLKQYNKFVKPSFEHYIEPTMTYADIIVPRGELRDPYLNHVL